MRPAPTDEAVRLCNPPRPPHGALNTAICLRNGVHVCSDVVTGKAEAPGTESLQSLRR